MKYLIIIGDGMADYPLKELDGATPLEVADKPSMDLIADRGRCGLLKTLDERFPLGSDVANLTILGYDPSQYHPMGRGPLEAGGMGIPLGEDEIAFRCNLITERDGRIIDYSAGHISNQKSRELMEVIDGEFSSEYVRFYHGVGYRHIMVLKPGDIYSDKIKAKPPHDIMGQKVDDNMIKAVSGEGKKTASELNNMMIRSRDILREHPINRERIEKGLNPANMMWFWGHGKKPHMERFEDKYGVKGGMISAVDLLKGIACYIGLDVLEVPGATGYLDTNYEGKADAALKYLKDADFIYIHVESPDEAGHEGSIEKKIKAIEDLDKRLISRILKGMEGERYKIAVLPDHATPVEVRTHTPDPVPFAIYSSGGKADSVKRFNEGDAGEGFYGIRDGLEFMKLFLSDC